MSTRRLYSQLDFQLARHKVSYTQQRNDVFEMLKYMQPCTLKQLEDRLAGHISRRTVIRTVKILIETGLAFRPEGKLIYIAPRLIQHRHVLSCTKCRREIPYRDTRIEDAIGRLAKSRNFTPSAHTLAILGTCGQCVD